MELGTTLIGLFITALCIAPFIWFSYTNKQHKKEIIDSLSQDTATKITTYEFCGDMAFGHSAKGDRAFFYKKTKDQTIKQAIALGDFKSCQVVKTTETPSNGRHQVVKQLDVTFQSKNSHQQDVTLPIYNADESMIMGGELLFAEKWVKELNHLIKSFN